MALNTKQPADLPSTDSLKDIPADLLGPVPAEIKLGQNTLMVMEKPPEVRDVITVVMRLRVKDAGVGEAGESNEELTHYRRCKIVAAWLKGEPEPPNGDEDQGALIDEDGEISDEAAGTEPDAAEDDGSWDDDNVARPNFSDKS